MFTRICMRFGYHKIQMRAYIPPKLFAAPKMSILNPRCKKCENGMIDGYPTSDEDEEEEEDEDDDEENLTKIETIVVVQISVLVVSLIGLLIGLV